MRFFKIATLASLLLVMVSCNKDVDTVVYYSKFTSMTPAQVVPAVTSAALGAMEYVYNPKTKVVQYKISFSGLSGAPTGISINGPAAAGFNGSSLQTVSLTGLTTASGSVVGTLFVDGIVVREDALLKNEYYVSIKTSTNAGGEIRGQIAF